MKSILLRKKFGLLATVACVALPTPSHAALSIVAEEAGGNVTFTWTGNLNTAGVSFAATNIQSATGKIAPFIGGFLGYDPSRSTIDISDTNTLNPSSNPFGTVDVGTVDASSFTGSPFGLDASGRIGVPAGYTSGSDLNGTLTFTGHSFASLGLTPSPIPFTWTFANTDTVKMTVAAVPEPSSTALLGLGGLALMLRRRR